MIYLDNSATTRVYDEVADMMVKIMTEDYGNPSSRHSKGLDAEGCLRSAKAELAKLLKVTDKELLFTSGGTESNNLALIGTARANRRAGNHIIVSSVEHPSVSETVKYLSEDGFKVTVLPVNDKGMVEPEEFAAAVCEDTILASVMLVNNEVGAVQPVERLAGILKEKRPGALFHADAVQAFGKYKIYPKRMNIDLLSASGHKIHGPKGVGLLYINDSVKIKPVIFGGGQQGGLRSGTDNVPGIAGIALAAKLIYTDFDKKQEKLYALKQMLIDGVKDIPDICVNTVIGRESAPHIVNISFLGVRSEVLLNMFNANGICVSAGSACAAHKQTANAAGRQAGSPTLAAMGADAARLDSAIRFSLSEMNTEEDIARCLEVLHAELPRLRRFIRK